MVHDFGPVADRIEQGENAQAQRIVERDIESFDHVRCLTTGCAIDVDPVGAQTDH